MKIKDNNYKGYESIERNSDNIIEFPRQYICGANALDVVDSKDMDIESVDFELFESEVLESEVLESEVLESEVLESELCEPELLDSKAVGWEREIMSGKIISYPREGLLSDIFSYVGVMASVVIIMSEILKWLMFM